MFGGPSSLSLRWRGTDDAGPGSAAPGPGSPSPSPPSVAGRRDPYRPFFTVPCRVPYMRGRGRRVLIAPSRSPHRQSGATLDIFSLAELSIREVWTRDTLVAERVALPPSVAGRRDFYRPFSLFRAAPSTCEVMVEAHSSPSHALLIGGPGRPWTFFLCGIVRVGARRTHGRACRPSTVAATPR